MDDDGTARPAAGGPGEEPFDPGAPTVIEAARPWWRRRWALIMIIALVAGAGALYLVDGRYGASGWCGATDRVRSKMADAVTGLDNAEQIFVAQVALANEEAPALVARADRMIWPRGDLADRAATALLEAAAAESPGDQRLPLQRFLELDNEFRHKHCNYPNRS